MRKELMNELTNVLMSAVALVYEVDAGTDAVDEFYYRTCAIEMNEELTEREIELLESIKHDIAQLCETE
jgi:hypothetical protein